MFFLYFCSNILVNYTIQRNDMRKIILAFLLFLPLTMLAQATGNATLVLHHADGTTTDVALFTQPRVTFTDGKLLVASPLLTMEYPAEQVLRFTYKGEGTGVALPHNEADYAQKDGQLVFSGLSAADRVAVYTTSGIRVPIRLVSLGNSLALPLSSIPQGVYILSVNGKTSKFTKR